MKSINPTIRTPLELESEIDQLVDRFEVAWNDQPTPPSLAEYLPADSEPHFQEGAAELIRVDMERRYSAGIPMRLSNYLNSFGWLQTQRDALAELAFEEYRQRHAAGEEVSPQDYAKLFGVDTSTWPTAESATKETNAFRDWNASTFGLLSNDADRLVESLTALPNAGETFGDFTIVEELGKGAFARVYLAKQNDLANREVSIKVAPELWSESDKLARLQHTNIMPIYSMHEVGQLHALCMPFLGRETLADRLRTVAVKDVRLFGDEKALARFAAKLADALEHAHVRNVVHRDLKPANILLGEDDANDELQPLILDFNLSENVVVGGPTSQLVGGTMPYMSPEQLRAILSRDRLTPATDVYSLGVLIYQLATGELPFDHREGNFADSVMQMAKDRRTDNRWEARLDELASSDLASIIRKCLQPSLEQRYASAREVHDDLIRHANDLPLKTARNRSLSQTIAKWNHRNRHRVTLGSVSIIAAGLVAAAIAFGLWQQHRTRRAEARREAALFQRELSSIRLGLLSKTAPDLRDRSAADAKRWADHFGVLNASAPVTNHELSFLDSAQRRQVQEQLGEMLLLWSESGTAHGSTAPEELRLVAGRYLFGEATAEWSVDDLPNSQANRQLVIANHIKRGRFAEATGAIESAVQAGTNQESLWFYQGICQQEAGNSSDAELSFTRFIAMMPNDPIGYFHRGALRLETADAIGALEDFDRVLGLEPQLAFAQLNRAIALNRLGRHQDAGRQLDEIQAPGRLAYRILMLQSKIAGAMGDDSKKSKLDEALLAQTPEDAVGWVHRALMQRASAPEDAIADLQTALALQPGNRDALQNLAAMYAEVIKDNAKAHEVLNAWIAAFTNDPVPFASRSVLFAREGRVEQALEQIEQSRLRGDSAECFYYRSCALAQLGKVQPEFADAAIEEMRLCLNLDIDAKWFNQAVRDPDLIPLRSNKQFGRLFAAAQLMNDGTKESAEIPTKP